MGIDLSKTCEIISTLMQLKRITISGFKSFRDKSVIPFGDGITAIVGPNGCGKSNVLDAIRWALGEGSAKSLRTGKMPDVLFGGTEKSKGKGIAEVKVLFETLGDPLQVGASEIEIGRRLSADGQSDYTVNDKAVRLKDLHLLLHKMGLGKEGFWCFEQGKVDQVVAWSPEERRSVFEETSGISLYLSQKRDALEKLKETKNNLEKLIEREKEATKLLEVLKTQAESTEKYLKIKERSHRVERELYTARLFHVQESIKNEEIRHHTIVGEKLALENEEKILKEQLLPLEEEDEKKQKEKQHLEETLLHLHHAIENGKRELDGLEGRLRGLQNVIQDRQLRIDKEEKNKLQILQEIEELKKINPTHLIKGLKEKLEAILLEREKKEESLEQLLLAEQQEEALRMEIVKEKHLVEQKLTQIQQGKRAQQEITKVKEEIDLLEKKGLVEDQQLQPSIQNLEERLKLCREHLKHYSEETAKCSGRLKSIEEMIKKLPGPLAGNKKVLEWYPEEATPLLKKFPLEKADMQKGNALFGSHFDAVFLENVELLPTIVDRLKGLSYAFYIGKDLEEMLKDWEISAKSFTSSTTLLEEERVVVQEELKSFQKQKDDFALEESELQKKLNNEKILLSKQQEEIRRRGWELERNKEQLKKLVAAAPKVDLTEEATLLKRLHELVIPPSNRKSLLLKQELDQFRKEEKDFRQKISEEEKKFEEREKRRLLKERDFEEREREKTRLLTEKKELQQKLSLLPQEIDPVKIRLEKNRNQQVENSNALTKLKEIVLEYGRKIADNKRALENLSKRIVNIKIEEDRSKHIFVQLMEKLMLLEVEIDEQLGCKLEGKRTESTLKELEREWKEIKQLLEGFTDVSLTALERYKQEIVAVEALRKDIIDLDEACQKGLQWIEELDKESVKKFLDVFTQVNSAFEQSFQKLFKGGQASLRLTKPQEPLTSGIEIAAQPPGKAVKSLQLLSGGEKCLVGIALLIALFTVKKAPIALFDEVDAPLDEANLHRFVDLLLPFSKETQVIQITHKRYTMEVASALLGVTMAERGVSKVLPLTLKEAALV